MRMRRTGVARFARCAEDASEACKVANTRRCRSRRLAGLKAKPRHDPWGLPQGWCFALASVVLMYAHEERRNGSNQIFLELRGYAGESDASLDSGCRVRNGKAQLPNHVNPPSVTVLGIVERVVARTSLLSHHLTSATTAKMMEHIEHQH